MAGRSGHFFGFLAREDGGTTSPTVCLQRFTESEIERRYYAITRRNYDMRFFAVHAPMQILCTVWVGFTRSDVGASQEGRSIKNRLTLSQPRGNIRKIIYVPNVPPTYFY